MMPPPWVVAPDVLLSWRVRVRCCLCQGSPETTTPPRQAPTASRARSRCCSPGTASRPCWTCSGVPSFESFEDDCSQSLGLSKPTMSFKDYIQERRDPVEQGKPVIPAAVLAGFTGGRHPGSPSPPLHLPSPAPALFIKGVSRWTTLC